MQKKLWHTMDVQDVLQLLSVSPKGLANAEADKRREQVGENRLNEAEQTSLLTLFFNQFRDFMVLVLLAATLVSGLLGEHADAITIIAIIIVNGILGFFQELRAEKSLASLKQLTAPTATVLRDGKKVSVPALDLVPGDILFLEAGDRVPADVRVLDSASLEAEESALTGESLPVQKLNAPVVDGNATLGDRKNMCYMGTLITRGKGTAVVCETGMHTEMGLIADLIQTAEDTETPLQRRLEQLGKILVYVALGITAVVVATGVFHGNSLYTMFLAGVSLAVAAIPEGLPAIVTVALALGVQRMIKRKAIVRKLPSVETLGCATVICSDKTGTLTQNKMTVQRVFVGGQFYDISGTGYNPDGEFLFGGKAIDPHRRTDLKRLLEVSVLCNNALLTQDTAKKHPDWMIQGDPTEGALMVLGAKAGLRGEEMDAAQPRIDELPFDSTRKMMSVLTRDQKGELFMLTKGAPDVLLDRCGYMLIDGKVTPLTHSLRKGILGANHAMGTEALRCLALAYRPLKSEQQFRSHDPEQDLIFIGMVGMIDPPRPEVFDAIARCKKAGIKTVMITGDHQVTAEAIARQLGILQGGGLTVNGQDLYNMSDRELQERVDDIFVYARVSPEHKLRIVKALQANGHVVAMTGDGVNDAPAIKAADIGIAMGLGGTDVAKDASSLILSDDNFATIVAAIEEGRSIYDNIRKFIRYLLASNVGEIVTMFLAMILALPLPLVPIQILWVNLVTDGLPAIALGVDPAEKGIMNRPPRNVRESIFARGLGFKILSRGILIGIATLAVFWFSLQMEPDNLIKAQSMAFVTLVMAQLIHVFDCRSVEGGIFSRNLFENKWLIWSVLSSVLLLLGVMYIPAFQPVFRTVPLGGVDWLIVLFAAAVPTFALAAGRGVSKKKTSTKINFGRR
ncbi:calcium-translocating P-type ATPase, SERCA-type [Tumebacillus permanentifrigoris]|uniref:P-type Ca(2+) transporter n=1 Tax=Tumebacillus permanentifrigoris TaxID=378543 RepID=A0A316D7U5_9BACL|nr:calcium-translocating P-type ATPase, SERCA-type [Tumebacillus permanentifrigoris]PWK12809.1 Ca2+-transporting ATPase [Tumebacillus permanentifrigoris]